MNLEDRPSAGAGSITVTVIQSSPEVGLDRLAGWLPGLDVRVVRADLGEAVPADVADAGEGLIVLGGPMSAYDDVVAPWLPATRALLSAAVTAGLPTLGICLGAQLLAVARGGRVQVGAPPGHEGGVIDVRWRPEATGDRLVGALVVEAAAHERRSTPMPSMHADAVVELPAGAVWLAASATYPYQAFRVGSAWGLQFHPETGAATLRTWADQVEGLDTEAALKDFAARDAEITRGARALGEGFAAVVRETARGRLDVPVG